MSALIPAYQTAAFLGQRPQKSAMPDLQRELRGWVQQQGLSEALNAAALLFQGKTVFVEPPNHPSAAVAMHFDFLNPAPLLPMDARVDVLLSLSTKDVVIQGRWVVCGVSWPRAVMHACT